MDRYKKIGISDRQSGSVKIGDRRCLEKEDRRSAKIGLIPDRDSPNIYTHNYIQVKDKFNIPCIVYTITYLLLYTMHVQSYMHVFVYMFKFMHDNLVET